MPSYSKLKRVAKKNEKVLVEQFKKKSNGFSLLEVLLVGLILSGVVVGTLALTQNLSHLPAQTKAQHLQQVVAESLKDMVALNPSQWFDFIQSGEMRLENFGTLESACFTSESETTCNDLEQIAKWQGRIYYDDFLKPNSCVQKANPCLDLKESSLKAEELQNNPMVEFTIEVAVETNGKDLKDLNIKLRLLNK